MRSAIIILALILGSPMMAKEQKRGEVEPEPKHVSAEGEGDAPSHNKQAHDANKGAFLINKQMAEDHAAKLDRAQSTEVVDEAREEESDTGWGLFGYIVLAPIWALGCSLFLVFFITGALVIRGRARRRERAASGIY